MTVKDLIELLEVCNPHTQAVVLNPITGEEFEIKDADGDGVVTRIQIVNPE